jgi:hypothetical protein
MFAPFMGIFFLVGFFLAVEFLAANYPSFGFLVFPVFLVTNIALMLGGVVRSRSK